MEGLFKRQLFLVSFSVVGSLHVEGPVESSLAFSGRFNSSISTWCVLRSPVPS